MGATVPAFIWVDLVEIFGLLGNVAVVAVVLVDIVLLAVALSVSLPKSAEQRIAFFACTTLIQFALLLLLALLSHKLYHKVILAKVLESLHQFIGVGVDEDLASFAVFEYVVIQFLDAVIIDAAVVGKIGNEPSKAIFALEDGDLVVQGLNLFRNELSDVDRLLLVVDLELPVLCNCFAEEFLLIYLEKVI